MPSVASGMELRGQKALPCCRQPALAHEALWEFGTGREPINLSFPYGLKKLSPVGGWGLTVARGG